jgi:hypothetical protein
VDPVQMTQPETTAAWERTACRACAHETPVEILSLGDLPPANAYLRPDEIDQPEPRYPLSLRLCEQCGLVQLGHVVPPEMLFRSYLFFTSSSQRMSEHFARLMAENADAFVPAGGLIVEIGSNDGTALSSIQRRDLRVLGVDPSLNLSELAASRGVPTIAEFFTEALATEIATGTGRAQLVVGCNVLGHIDDLDDVCRGLDALLAADGAFVFEVPYLGELLDRTEYDTIYHEHLSYFAVSPLVRLFNRNGLRLERVERHPVHGGSIRGTVVRGDGHGPTVERWLEAEEARSLAELPAYEAFAHETAAEIKELPGRLAALRDAGLVVVGYGAPAKGTIVLNACAIGIDLVAVVIDSTPAKQGLHVPGTHQRIVAPTALEELGPDVALLLAWNHADEIVAREQRFRERGGRFLTPHLEEIS